MFAIQSERGEKMKLIRFLDVVLITFVVYLPLLIGKYKKNEESLFWAASISSLLGIISLFLMKDIHNLHPYFQKIELLPLLVSFVIGFGAYSLYRINRDFKRKSFYSPLTWLVFLPFVDTVILRKFGIDSLSWMQEVHQLLVWYVSLRVFILAILAGFVYFLIFFRNRLFVASWEGSIAFTSSLVAGYIFVHYGFTNALLAEVAFNFWRVALAKKEGEI